MSPGQFSFLLGRLLFLGGTLAFAITWPNRKPTLKFFTYWLFFPEQIYLSEISQTKMGISFLLWGTEGNFALNDPSG